MSGKGDGRHQNERLHGSSPLPVTSSQQHHAQLMPTVPGKSAVIEEPHYVAAPDLSDQPLDFVPRFSHEHGWHTQHAYAQADSAGPVGGVDPVAAMPSSYNWPRTAASGVDRSVSVPSPVPGHTPPVSGRVHGASYHPAGLAAGSPFSVDAGAAMHPPAAFLADAYGISGVTDRPKKASVPNWLREEIIKKKAVITSSAPDFPMEDSQSIEDEGVDRSYGKGDQADRKSIDSSRSTEEEDDYEDDVGVARTAAINQEIKRVLTEVLLKVTDELFDEIATKVLSEEDIAVDVKQEFAAYSQKVWASVQAVPTPKAPTKVLIPSNIKEADSLDTSEKSTSSSPGDILGLANYASDDEDDNEIQSAEKPKERDNGRSHKSNEHDRSPISLENNSDEVIPRVGMISHVAEVSKLNDDRLTTDSSYGGARNSTRTESGVHDEEILGEVVKSENAVEILDLKKSKTDNSRSQDARYKSDKSSKPEARKSSVVKDNGVDVRSVKEREAVKEEGKSRKHDERNVRKEKVNDVEGSKDRVREKSRKSREKARESDSRRRPSPDVKEGKKEAGRDGRAGVTSDSGRRRDSTKDDKKEKSKHKGSRDSGRHKRHRSSSVESRGREGKDNSKNRVNDSSDESSEDSKRKGHQNRHRSPSPVRSRKRHVSRSPHRKHSQHRHSPYSSLESSRRRKSKSRSRSRSPVRRKR